ncbi:MAG: peptidoglycan DD-metalloendopeptidase family protein [bacterium]
MGRDLRRSGRRGVRAANFGVRRRTPVRIRYLLLLLASLALMWVSTLKPGLDKSDLPEYRSKITDEIVPVKSNLDPPLVPEIRVGRIKRGDTLYGILRELGIDDVSIMNVATADVEDVNLSRLVAGRTYKVFTVDDKVVEYQYEPDDSRVVSIIFGDSEPGIRVSSIPYEIETLALSGTIEDSLFGAVEKIGEKPSLALDLSEIFAWQIDFFRDLRKGDTFTVLLEEVYRDGKFVKYGDILAAKFINADKEYSAFLFSGSSVRRDYFNREGGSLRKQFLKAPLRFRRISSGYTGRRLHPVTGKVVAHRGIDYAAPAGTPIRSIGDGKVVLRKKDRVNGRILKVRHNSVYSSAYSHMRSFAPGIRVGTTVRQGQIIGYVGTSGRATGPHLHLTMYRNGRYVNPKSVKVPRASTLAGKELETFRFIRDNRDALLKDAGTHEMVLGEAGR